MQHGPWEDVEISEFDYDLHIKQHDESRRKEQLERKKRLAKAERPEKTWELTRLCKTFMPPPSPHLNILSASTNL